MARFSFRSVLWQPAKPADGPTLNRLSSIRQGGAIRHRPCRNWSTQWGTPELRPAIDGRPLPWIAKGRRHRTIAAVGDQWRPPFAPPPPVIPRDWIIAATRHRVIKPQSTDWAPPPRDLPPPTRPLPWLIGARAIRHRVWPQPTEWIKPQASVDGTPTWLISNRARHATRTAQVVRFRLPAEVVAAPPPDRVPPWTITSRAGHRRVAPQSREWAPPLALGSTDRVPDWLISARARHATRTAQVFRIRVPAEVVVAPVDRVPPWTLTTRTVHRRAPLPQSRDWAPPLALPTTDRVPPWLIARSRRRGTSVRSLEWGPVYGPPAAPRWSLVWMARHRPVGARGAEWSPAFQIDGHPPGWLLHRAQRHRGAGVRSGRWGAVLDTTTGAVVGARPLAWGLAQPKIRRHALLSVVRWGLLRVSSAPGQEHLSPSRRGDDSPGLSRFISDDYDRFAGD